MRPVDRTGLVVMALPCLAYFFVFNYVPMLGIVVAFKDFIGSAGIAASPWAGLGNFRRLFADDGFHGALVNTIVIGFLKLAVGFVAPLALAIALSELRNLRFRRFVQTVTYAPYLLSWVILGGIFLLVFAADGPLNRGLIALSGSPVSFLGDDTWFLVVLVVTHVWHSAGYGAVIYLAALAAIPQELYEAASIDGASRWQKLRHVTLPALVPSIIVLLTLNLGHILNAGFDQIYNLYNPLVYDAADILDTYVLRRALNLEFGLSTAADLFKSAVGLVLVLAANALARRLSRGEHSLW